MNLEQSEVEYINRALGRPLHTSRTRDATAKALIVSSICIATLWPIDNRKEKEKKQLQYPCP